MSTRKPIGYWTKELCITDAKKYKTPKEWKINNNAAKCASVRLKCYAEATKHMGKLRKPNGYWTDERILESALKFKTKTEWEEKESAAYSAFRRHKNGELFTEHMVDLNKPAGFWQVKENVLDSAKKYTYVTEWERSSEGAAVQNARDNGWYDEATKHMEIKRVYDRTDEEIKAIKSEYNTRYREENYEKLKTYEKQYDYDRRESKSIKTKKFYSENRERFRVEAIERKANWTPEQQENYANYQEQYRVINAGKLFIKNCVHRTFEDKKTSVEEAEKIIGYDRNQLRLHIENQFIEGMSWDNRTDWHIDHIKPLSAFRDEDITDPAIINALSNLHPIWAVDNRSKRNNYDPKVDLPVEVHENVHAA